MCFVERIHGSFSKILNHGQKVYELGDESDDEEDYQMNLYVISKTTKSIGTAGCGFRRIAQKRSEVTVEGRLIGFHMKLVFNSKNESCNCPQITILLGLL
jgi:hypothetical protein